MIRVDAAEAFETLKKLKGEGYNMLVDFTAVDWSAIGPSGDASNALKRAQPAERKDKVGPIALSQDEEYGTPRSVPGTAPVDPFLQPRPSRFEVVWRLMKLDPDTGEDKGREEVRAYVPEGEAVLRSAMSLWPIADWLEREVWDMFGVKFVDRPDIKRLLLYEEFKGHPLRKDYPITRRQPLIGPKDAEPLDNPSFNRVTPGVPYE